MAKERDPWPFTVWENQPMGCPLIDKFCATKIEAKKHAAWLFWARGSNPKSCQLPFITDSRDTSGDHIDYSDYEFRNGDSRKVIA